MSSENNEGVSLKHQSNVARLADTEFHDWYRFVFAYSDRIITTLVDEYSITEDDLVLDPFNGTGTTTLASKKLGIDSIGADVSPISTLAARSKTNWDIDLDEFRTRRDELLQTIEPVFNEISAEGNVTLRSFSDSNVSREAIDLSKYDFAKPEKTPKDWLSEKPRKKMLALRHHIEALPDDEVTDLLRLAMCAILPESVANIGFGPEAYRVSMEDDVDVLNILITKLDKMESDLCRVQEEMEKGFEPGETEILDIDARHIGAEIRSQSKLFDRHGSVDYVITSPPYPAEHDYTRNQRLELVWLGILENNQDLQRIKKRNIRSNTKNIYVADDDGEQLNIRDNSRIDDIIIKMENIIEEEDIQHGFGQYYPRVIEEYFAGMERHLRGVYELLSPGGRAIYVVADSGSYWQVDVQTGTILSEIAENRIGYELEGLKLWRELNATTGEKDQREELLILRKPK